MRSPFTIEPGLHAAFESHEWEGAFEEDEGPSLEDFQQEAAFGEEFVFEQESPNSLEQTTEGEPPYGELFESQDFETGDGPAVPAGREEIARVPLLGRHKASGPALILNWNDLPARPQSVDVVVHLHGFALCARDSSIPWPRIASSGLDWSDPQKIDRVRRRVRSTLGIVPRGHLFGGKTGAGYSFPALTTETGLRELIRLSLNRLAQRLGVRSLAEGRLILTAHSGGGAALLKMLSYHDPHEVHIFDGLYQDATKLIQWAKSRLARDQQALAARTEPAESYMARQGGALRILYRPETTTEQFSRPVSQALLKIIPPDSELRRWYRVERTCVGHCLIPRIYGWRLLADASAAPLPGASAEHPRTCTRRAQSGAGSANRGAGKPGIRELETSEDFGWSGEAGNADRIKGRCECRKCREAAELEGSLEDTAGLESEANFESEVGAWASRYPVGVRAAIDLGGAMWPLALQRAIEHGIRDPNALANLAFYMNVPERNGRPIASGEAGASGLIEAWKFFRESAKNMLRPASSPSSAPSVSCGKTVPQVNTLMPESAPGLEAKKPVSHRYGLPEVIAALKATGQRWQTAHPSGPLIRIRDISRCGGGAFPPHGSHRMGIDVDIGLMRNDGRTDAVNFKTQASKYSRPLTQEMVNTIRNNGILKVHRLWFSDRGVTNVDYDNIHNNHVHVRFCLPPHYDLQTLKRAAYPGGTTGTYASCK